MMWKSAGDASICRPSKGGDWRPSSCSVKDLDEDEHVIECDADGNPLDAKPAPLTLADLEAFEARLRVNLEALRTP